LLVGPTPCIAAPASLNINADQQLRFGTFVVPTIGSRTVSATGAITNVSIVPIGGGAGPAQFTLSYDRGNQNSKVLSITVSLVMDSVPGVTQGGVSATVSNFDTDLPGTLSITPGQPITYTLANCATRVCSQTFHVGGRIDMTRSSGGATLNVPLNFTASLLAVN
jgi:hypothetical protein